MRFAPIAAAALVVVATGRCRGEPRQRAASDPESELRQYDAMGPRYEARAWLAATANPYPFASNRFESREAVAAFFDTLYAFGAETVYVLNVEDEQEGPYADALLLRVPDERAARGRLFEIDAREARHEGFDPDEDTGQRYLYFWWD